MFLGSNMIKVNSIIDVNHKDVLVSMYDLGGYISGSFAAYYARPDIGFKPGDIDIFVKDEESAVKIITYLNEKYGINIFTSDKKSSIYNDSEIFTLTVLGSPIIKYQVVIRKLSIDKLMKDFDFTICKAYFTPDLNHIMVDPCFMGDVDNRRLRVTTSPSKRNIQMILYRYTKYINRGFKPKFEDLVQSASCLDREDRHLFFNNLVFNFKDILPENVYNKIKLMYGFSGFDKKVEIINGANWP